MRCLMHIKKIAQIAWRGLTRNKLRSLLTMLGVIIGVAAVIVMISISAGTEKAIRDRITGLGSNLVYVQAAFSRMGPGMQSSGGGLVYDDAWAIRDNLSGVKSVDVTQNSSESVKAGDVSVEDVTIMGTTTGFPSVRDMTVAAGRYVTQNDIDRKARVAVLGSSLATELFGNTSPIGQVVTVGDVKLTVVGVFEPKGLVGNTDYDAQLFAPITLVFEKFTPSFFARVMGDSVREITVELQDDADLTTVVNQITLLLARRHDVSVDEADFTVRTQEDVIATQESTTAAFRSLLSWVAGVSLIVGGIGIMNIMLVSVTERTREIGIRQSVGATPNDIRLQFISEALLLSMVGGLIGVVVGLAGALLYGAVGDMTTAIVPSSILLAFSSAAAVGIFFGFYPANKAAQLDPIEALRHE
jgi:putative ABC transport system permease protein